MRKESDAPGFQKWAYYPKGRRRGWRTGDVVG